MLNFRGVVCGCPVGGSVVEPFFGKYSDYPKPERT